MVKNIHTIKKFLTALLFVFCLSVASDVSAQVAPWIYPYQTGSCTNDMVGDATTTACTVADYDLEWVNSTLVCPPLNNADQVFNQVYLGYHSECTGQGGTPDGYSRIWMGGFTGLTDITVWQCDENFDNCYERGNDFAMFPDHIQFSSFPLYDIDTDATTTPPLYPEPPAEPDTNDTTRFISFNQPGFLESYDTNTIPFNFTFYQSFNAARANRLEYRCDSTRGKDENCM